MIGEDIAIVDQPEERLPLVALDRSQRGQTLMNFAINARDAMPGAVALSSSQSMYPATSQPLLKLWMESGEYVTWGALIPAAGFPWYWVGTCNRNGIGLLISKSKKAWRTRSAIYLRPAREAAKERCSERQQPIGGYWIRTAPCKMASRLAMGKGFWMK